MEQINIKEIREDVNEIMFELPGIGLNELKLSNNILNALEKYQEEINTPSKTI
jgi:hypothetical protein